jgi:hypothetical protein
MYLLDGAEIGYEECMRTVVAALEDGEYVSHAYHQGADCYWLEEAHPWFSSPVHLTDEGVTVGDKVIEAVQAC